MSEISPTYWQDATADEAMQDDPVFVRNAMLETIGSDLVDKKIILDAGCNRGGFLRLQPGIRRDRGRPEALRTTSAQL